MIIAVYGAPVCLPKRAQHFESNESDAMLARRRLEGKNRHRDVPDRPQTAPTEMGIAAISYATIRILIIINSNSYEAHHGVCFDKTSGSVTVPFSRSASTQYLP